MAIVELAPNQTVPKNSCETAKQCDERVDTLANDVSFLKFMRCREAAETAAAAAIADGSARTDFDELVRQLEEKRRRLEEGQVQETPLTEYIRRMALEKARKPRRRSAGAEQTDQSAKDQQQQQGLKIKKILKPSNNEADNAAVQMAPEAAAQKNTTTRTKTRRERRRRKEQREKTESESKKFVVADGEDGKAAANAETKSAIRIKIRKSRRRGSGGAGGGVPLAAASQPNAPSAAGGKETGAASSTAAAVGTTEGQSGAKRRGTDSGDRKSASAPKSGEAIKGSRRNKERPEREIYRPGQRKAAAAALKAASSADAQNPNAGGGEGE